MIGTVLVDAGPLVAIASPWDQYHHACVEQLHELRPPMITSWPVLAETTWLLRNESDSLQNLCQMVQEGWLEIPPLGIEVVIWYSWFVKRYAKIKPQLADATLVYLAEQLNIEQIFTVDRRDFAVYRIGKHRPFRLLPQSM